MLWRLLANLVVLVHGLSILFIVFGGFLTWRWRWLAWVHGPFAVWGILIEYFGWVCPLTPLENHFRAKAGLAGYSGGFVEHYLLPVIYPAGLTPRVQFVLGTLVLAVNLVAYTGFAYRGWKGS
ncbi:MAG TPA: DUF2784 domain-containing protein [Gemmatimonadales bacterium]|nr:DUF2784 domain-containing protein [Gemmatimonadales bacterium]